MRRYRERSRISLDEVALCTRIRQDLLESFERCDLSEWPRGLYARAWVRAYANAIGLDADEAVEEFCRLFPEGDRRAHHTMVELAGILDVRARFHEGQAQVEGPRYG